MMLRARWLGRVPYAEGDQLQRALHERATDDYLLLLEHPHVYTLGSSADPEHVLVPPASVGAELAQPQSSTTSNVIRIVGNRTRTRYAKNGLAFQVPDADATGVFGCRWTDE